MHLTRGKFSNSGASTLPAVQCSGTTWCILVNALIHHSVTKHLATQICLHLLLSSTYRFAALSGIVSSHLTNTAPSVYICKGHFSTCLATQRRFYSGCLRVPLPAKVLPMTFLLPPSWQRKPLVATSSNLLVLLFASLLPQLSFSEINYLVLQPVSILIASLLHRRREEQG